VIKFPLVRKSQAAFRRTPPQLRASRGLYMARRTISPLAFKRILGREPWIGNEFSSVQNEPFGLFARITGRRGSLSDDSELWRQICRGNAEVFDVFYRDNAQRLQAFLRQIVGSPQVAEDIMQEVFTKLWCHPNGFQPNRGTLRAYLYGIGRKSAAEWWRRQSPGVVTGQSDASASRTESMLIVGDVFEQLSIEQRTLLWLREVEGQSYVELAQCLDIPVGTVRSRLFAAREALREIWMRTRQNSKENV
jgi:RNA polymerase sigma-70 factor, ECF subfamily